MKVVAVDNTAGGTVLVAAGAPVRPILFIKNGSAVVYLRFDGSSTTLDSSVGFPLAANEVLNLSGLPVTSVRAICATTSNVAVQGD